MLADAGMEAPSHTVEIQFQGPRMSAVAVSEANGTSNQPIVRRSVSDFPQHSDEPNTAASFAPSGAAFTPPGVTSQTVLAGVGTEAPTHTVEIQFHGERMSAVTVAMANAASHRPTVQAPAVDAIEHSEKSRSETAALSTMSALSASRSRSDTVSRLDEQQKDEKEEEDAAGGKCCCCKRKRKPADKEGQDAEASTNEGAPAEGQPGQKRSWFSCCKKQPSNQAENETASKPLAAGTDGKIPTNTDATEVPGEGQSRGKRSCFSCRKKQPSDQAEEETASKSLAGRDAKVPEEVQPGEKRSCFSRRKKQPSDQAESVTPGGKMLSTASEQSSLRLASAYVGDDGRRPESAQPFEYTRSRSLPFSLAAPAENGLSCPGLEAPTHTAEVKSQGPRLSPVNATAARARLNQPAFHSPVTDLTEQCDSTRPWKPPCPPPEEGKDGWSGQRYQNASPGDPTTQSRFIIGQSERRTPPVSTPECAEQTVVVNTPENSLASHGNRTTVECALDAQPQGPQGFGQQRQLGLNGIARCQCSVGECLLAARHPCPRIRPLAPPPQNGNGQTVWVLMPMSMGANGMFGLPAPCSCHGRR
nr:unnamed protein product [Spirometra erinaceieuropaei]